MKEVVGNILTQGLPKLLFVFSALCILLSFFEIADIKSLHLVPRLYPQFLIMSLVLLAISVGLSFLDREKKSEVRDAIEGHYELIRLLHEFSKANDFRTAEGFAHSLSGSIDDSRAARYGAMYLRSLGLLEANASGSEYRTTAHADTLLKDPKFRARNAGAFSARAA